MDLFEHYENLPEDIQEVILSFDEDHDLYNECERLLEELKPLGYTFDYYLDGVPYNLRKINPV